MASPLIDLPTEIRLQIYRYTLPTKQLYKISVSTSRRYLTSNSRPRPALLRRAGSACQTSVLRLNRQIMHEAYDVFYGENTFRFELEQGGWYGSDSWTPTLGTHLNPFCFLGNWTRPAAFIRKCRLFIRTDIHYRHSRKAYLYLERWFADFAALFEQHHPRLDLRVSCGEYLNARRGLLRMRLTNSYALEPLASLRDKRKKKGSNIKADITKTLKQYHQPRIDWNAIEEEGQWVGRAKRGSSEMSRASSSASDAINEDLEL